MPRTTNEHLRRGDLVILVITTPEGVEHRVPYEAAAHDLASQYVWFMRTDGYAGTSLPAGSGAKTLFLHHLVLGVKPEQGVDVDHIDGDRSNNRRSNLRVVRHSYNAANQAIENHRGRSRFRGVSWYPKTSRWVASVCIDYRSHHVGYFRTEEDAAAALVEFRRANGLPPGY